MSMSTFSAHSKALLPPGGKKNLCFNKLCDLKYEVVCATFTRKRLPDETLLLKYVSCLFFFFYTSVQKQLLLDEGQNVLMKKVLDTYLLFFQINQSTTTLRHVFASLRLFVQKVGQTPRTPVTSK